MLSLTQPLAVSHFQLQAYKQSEIMKDVLAAGFYTLLTSTQVYFWRMFSISQNSSIQVRLANRLSKTSLFCSRRCGHSGYWSDELVLSSSGWSGRTRVMRQPRERQKQQVLELCLRQAWPGQTRIFIIKRERLHSLAHLSLGLTEALSLWCVLVWPPGCRLISHMEQTGGGWGSRPCPESTMNK